MEGGAHSTIESRSVEYDGELVALKKAEQNPYAKESTEEIVGLREEYDEILKQNKSLPPEMRQKLKKGHENMSLELFFRIHGGATRARYYELATIQREKYEFLKQAMISKYGEHDWKYEVTAEDESFVDRLFGEEQSAWKVHAAIKHAVSKLTSKDIKKLLRTERRARRKKLKAQEESRRDALIKEIREEAARKYTHYTDEDFDTAMCGIEFLAFILISVATIQSKGDPRGDALQNMMLQNEKKSEEKNFIENGVIKVKTIIERAKSAGENPMLISSSQQPSSQPL